MPPRKAVTAESGVLQTGKRSRTTVAEANAAAALSARSTASSSKKPAAKRARKALSRAASEESDDEEEAAPTRKRATGKKAAPAAAGRAGVAAAPVDRYPDKTIPELLGCAIPLRTFCLSYPQAYEDFPWKHRVFKVGAQGKGKIFAYLGGEAGISAGLGLKLPTSAQALVRDANWVEPMGYGMGKSGWVNMTFPEDISGGHPVTMDALKRYIDESYRAIANKTQTKQINVKF